MMTDAQRIERYHQGLKNAEARLSRCLMDDDSIGAAYNERMIVKYKKLISEPLRPLAPPIPWK